MDKEASLVFLVITWGDISNLKIIKPQKACDIAEIGNKRQLTIHQLKAAMQKRKKFLIK